MGNYHVRFGGQGRMLEDEVAICAHIEMDVTFQMITFLFPSTDPTK